MSSCCASRAAGEWLFPDGEMVPIQSYSASFYRNRGEDGTVNLNRLNNDVMMPTGKFCCVVPDATRINQRVCAYIGKSMNCTIIKNIIVVIVRFIF